MSKADDTNRTDETHVLSGAPETATGQASRGFSASRSAEPALVLIRGELSKIVFRLHDGRNTVGRGPDSDVRIAQRMVSQQHAELIVADGRCVLRDTGSKNGTLLNGSRIEDSEQLAAGDVIRIGLCEFKYEDRKLDVEFLESLHHLATRDSLTGVANKAHAMRLLGDTLSLTGTTVSIALFDLDHFKAINDTYGHAAGDAVLRESCAIIRDAAIRSGDILGRIGGEEFIVILPETPLEAAYQVAERMRAVIEQHRFVFDDRLINLTISIGIAAADGRKRSAEDLLREADEQLYAAKRSGRNRVAPPAST